MNYGFLIDNRKCIGCHACSTACKSENEVPLGVNRTWVKYVEKGEFPDTRRYFQVTRCNHCAHPPCVPICPTKAMYQREDGIVEFDSDICIGCKACMQACPYDADLHRSGLRHGRQVPFLRAPHGRRAGARLCRRLPGPRHHRGRHRRRGLGDLAPALDP